MKTLVYRIRTKQGNLEVCTYPAYKFFITKVSNVIENRKIESKTSEFALEALDAHKLFCQKYLVPLLKKG